MKNSMSSANRKDCTCGKRRDTFSIRTAVSRENIIGDNVSPCLIPAPGWKTPLSELIAHQEAEGALQKLDQCFTPRLLDSKIL
jgi:hypothetical protein